MQARHPSGGREHPSPGLDRAALLVETAFNLLTLITAPPERSTLAKHEYVRCQNQETAHEPREEIDLGKD
jgi:hypothetical protein